jgi:hypothetical protein
MTQEEIALMMHEYTWEIKELRAQVKKLESDADFYRRTIDALNRALKSSNDICADLQAEIARSAIHED